MPGVRRGAAVRVNRDRLAAAVAELVRATVVRRATFEATYAAGDHAGVLYPGRLDEASAVWRAAVRTVAGLLFGDGPDRVPVSTGALRFADVLIDASFAPALTTEPAADTVAGPATDRAADAA
jgi:hypothetical protein